MAEEKDFPPYDLPDGSTVISPHQKKKIHMRTELLSATAGAALLLWAATRQRRLNEAERTGLVGLAIGAIIVDSYLYNRFRKSKKATKEG